MNTPIGVIDSGVGGLTVVKELMKRLPAEPIVYIGDDARCPYGPREAQEVLEFTMEMVTALSEMGIKLLVIACNTATAVALQEIQKRFDFPVVGVIQPGARAAVKASQTNEITILGTAGTVNSKAYNRAIEALEPGATVHSLACPPFVPIVESGKYRTAEAKRVVEETLTPLQTSSFDTVILGCTHYPLLEEHIQNHFGNGVNIISSAIETVVDVERELREQNLLAAEDLPPSIRFFTTGPTEKFRPIVEDWLGIEQPNVSAIQF